MLKLMQRFLFTCLTVSILFGCQSRSTYVSHNQGLTIIYPSAWFFGGEVDGVIMFRSYYQGDAAIRITTFEAQPQSIDLEGFMIEQLQSLVETYADSNKLVDYGEIKTRQYSDYLVVIGDVSSYSKIKVAPIDFFIRTYAAAIQFEDRIVFVTAQGTDRSSPQNAIDEIIKGLTFQ